MKRGYADRAKVVRYSRCDGVPRYGQNHEAASGPTPHARHTTILEQSHSFAKRGTAKTISVNEGRLIADVVTCIGTIDIVLGEVDR